MDRALLSKRTRALQTARRLAAVRLKWAWTLAALPPELPARSRYHRASTRLEKVTTTRLLGRAVDSGWELDSYGLIREGLGEVFVGLGATYESKRLTGD